MERWNGHGDRTGSGWTGGQTVVYLFIYIYILFCDILYVALLAKPPTPFPLPATTC